MADQEKEPVILQNAYIFTHASGSAVLGQKILANVVRSGIEVAINLWALLSSRTRQFFQGGSV